MLNIVKNNLGLIHQLTKKKSHLNNNNKKNRAYNKLNLLT
jgi:hypothetical protein